MTRPGRLTRFALVAVFAVALVAPGATSAASRGAFSYNLYRAGDFVSQYDSHWCIGASIQMMLNILDLTDDRTEATQQSYMTLARSMNRRSPFFSGSATSSTSTRRPRGTGSQSWADALRELGAGNYARRPIVGYENALRQGALALRKTGRPVGLLVWRGAHAWVMSGFTATADPLVDPDFQVTGVYVQDPWYGRVSRIWGPGQKPNTWLSVQGLKADFLEWRRRIGTYGVILPIDITSIAYGWTHA
jgi:hypothetical protein